jgi:hypothetical protein
VYLGSDAIISLLQAFGYFLRSGLSFGLECWHKLL